jgi:hypothetical protein
MPSHHTQIPIKAVAIVLRRITPSPCVLIQAHGHTEEGNARATWPRLEMSGRVYRAADQPKQIKLFPRGAHVGLFGHDAWEKTVAFGRL